MTATNEQIHVLRDGTRALVRPIRADDKERMVAGFRTMSPRSRYLRFHTPMSELDDRLLRYLTEVDHHDHVAWVALAADEPGHPGMGVARYVRLPAEPTVAEIAVTVVDRYQGRGLGTLLLEVLTRSARRAGIQTFRSYVLADNAGLLGLLDELGAVRTREAPGLYRVELALPEDPADLPDTPAGRVLREVARGNLPPLCPWHPLSWLRRLVSSGDGRQPPERPRTSGPPGREAPLLRAHLDQLDADGDPAAG